MTNQELERRDNDMRAIIRDVLPVWLSLMHSCDSPFLDPEWAEEWYEAAKRSIGLKSVHPFDPKADIEF
jgi:molybdopterin-guanine dinucleotide biosynthesis protein A